MKKFKWKSANIPKEAREFTSEEDAILDKLKFGKSELGKARKEAKRNVRFTITLLENNGALKKGCYMAVHELGKLLGSVKTAQKVIDCITPIITCNNHWIRESNTPRKFKIDDVFKNCNVMAELKEKILTPPPTLPPDIPVNEPEMPIEDLTPEIMNRDLFDPSDLLEALGLNDIEDRKETREDFIKAGIDPDYVKWCPCCALSYINMAFTLEQHNVCVDCWRRTPEKAKEASRMSYGEQIPYQLFTEALVLELSHYKDYMKYSYLKL